jgi:hypothetical protein
MYIRAQIGFQFDSTIPRDLLMITPHYSANDPTALGDALVANLKANTLVGTKPFTVNLYNVQAAPPSAPVYTGQQTGTPPSSNCPREVALCLSYYGGWNRPTFRGRVYIPATLLAGGTAAKPSGTQQTGAGSFATTLGKNLPSGNYMVVWSRKKASAAQVTDWWVDNEWDTIRSRGLKADSRVSGKF